MTKIKLNEKFDLLESIQMTDVEREALILSQKNKNLKHYMIIAVIISIFIGFFAGVYSAWTGASAVNSLTTVEVKVDKSSL